MLTVIAYVRSCGDLVRSILALLVYQSTQEVVQCSITAAGAA